VTSLFAEGGPRIRFLIPRYFCSVNFVFLFVNFFFVFLDFDVQKY